MDKQLSKVRFGSEDSLDKDVVHIFSEIPSFQECKDFCDGKDENRNIAIVEEGVVRECYKGTPDELNNALYETYSLHSQSFNNPIKRNIGRIAPLKVVRGTRIILSHLSKTSLREKIKKALKSKDFQQRIETLRDINFRSHSVSPDSMKSIAFQLGQTNALIQGYELYTKSQLSEHYPELSPFLYRRPIQNNEPLNQQRDLLLEQIKKIFTRKNGSLNLFCYRKPPEVREWNIYAKQSRGMIIDLKKERCVHYPLDKFFRIDEIEENRSSNLPKDQSVEIAEKIDGSMLSCFMNDENVIFASKGGFDTEPTKRAEIIAERYNLCSLDFKRFSYVFEVVYPENRFPQGMGIIDYGRLEDIFLVGMRDKLTNEPLSYKSIGQHAREKGLKSPESNNLTLEEVLPILEVDAPINREGYVARFENGRYVKIKYPSYNRTSKIMHDIWKNRVIKRWSKMDDNQKRDYLKSVLGHFKKIAEEHIQRYDRLKGDLYNFFDRVIELHEGEFPDYVLSNVPGILQTPLFRYWRKPGNKGNGNINLEKAILYYYENSREWEENVA